MACDAVLGLAWIWLGLASRITVCSVSRRGWGSVEAKQRNSENRRGFGSPARIVVGFRSQGVVSDTQYAGRPLRQQPKSSSTVQYLGQLPLSICNPPCASLGYKVKAQPTQPPRPETKYDAGGGRRPGQCPHLPQFLLPMTKSCFASAGPNVFTWKLG